MFDRLFKKKEEHYHPSRHVLQTLVEELKRRGVRIRELEAEVERLKAKHGING